MIPRLGRSLSIAALSCALATADDLELGRRLFESQCALCHGQTGAGGRGPALNRAKLAKAPDESALKKVISNGLPPEMPGAWQLTEREVASVAGFVKSLAALPSEPLRGDPKKGAAVYKAKGCASCHIIEGEGTAIGPELSTIGARRNAAYLRESITNPAAALPDNFLMLEAETRSGLVRGVRLNEDTFHILLRDDKGRFHSFRKTELKNLRKLSKASPMPAYSLSMAELDDLVAYLASLRGKS